MDLSCECLKKNYLLDGNPTAATHRTSLPLCVAESETDSLSCELVVGGEARLQDGHDLGQDVVAHL